MRKENKLNQKTNFYQEIFDKVSSHLLTQNKKSANSDPRIPGLSKTCRYRFENLKCAAGCLIPDFDYEENMEGFTAEALIYFKNAGYTNNEIFLIRRLQIIHDQYLVFHWKHLLLELAKDYSLSVSFD